MKYGYLTPESDTGPMLKELLTARLFTGICDMHCAVIEKVSHRFTES